MQINADFISRATSMKYQLSIVDPDGGSPLRVIESPSPFLSLREGDYFMASIFSEEARARRPRASKVAKILRAFHSFHFLPEGMFTHVMVVQVEWLDEDDERSEEDAVGFAVSAEPAQV